MPRAPLVLAALWAALVTAPNAARAELPPTETLRAWIEEMKASPRGPFESVRWFCEDGAIVHPQQGTCANHGGGIQHGVWGPHARQLRANGYTVANLIAELEPGDFTGPGADLGDLKQILVERFLIRADDGWIFRGAQSYRGAIQLEDEQDAAKRIVDAMLADPLWRDPARYFLLREAVRLLPRAASDTATAAQVRQLAIDVARLDGGFNALRAKIHNAPDAADAGRVREYAARRGRAAAAGKYEELAAAIDSLYASLGAAQVVRRLADQSDNAAFASALREDVRVLESASSPEEHFGEAVRLLAEYRRRLVPATPPRRAMALLEASLAMEDEAYASGNTLVAQLGQASRRKRIAFLRHGAFALFGTGLLGERQAAGVDTSVRKLLSTGVLTVETYREEARYLARVPEWAGRQVDFYFLETMEHFAKLDPLARIYSQDRLRGSPLLFYGAALDAMVADANELAGVEHQVFGKTVGAGVRALNPGLARGVLLDAPEGHAVADFRRDGIYLLPETTSELPPVAGILTRGEGSSLSHVQLLARNLGIPNVVIGEDLLEEVSSRFGDRAVLAVSPGGVVQLGPDGKQWESVFGVQRKAEDEIVIRPDLVKLDLTVTSPVPLSQVRSSDSGRICGPKGANLGELEYHFGPQVPDGFVIPFGAFRRVLDRPFEPGGPSVWDWMLARYAEIDDRSGDERARAEREFLERLRAWIKSADLGPEFRAEIVRALQGTFGSTSGYGVFVRSDTNVEDLADFTGAGLNLTVPNVVGTEKTLAAIREVWASPFTERAYAWRQSHMEQPAYVFPAVVVQLAFPSEKSGVLVTTDVETGDRGWLTLAVNEGVGGAVDGQPAEALRVRRDGAEVRFLAPAATPLRTVLVPGGGVQKIPASGSETLLQEDEIAQLVSFSAEVDRFPALQRPNGDVLPADVEFAFKDGRLTLLQMRPFNESKGARRNLFLVGLDAQLAKNASARVHLDQVPQVAAR